MAISASRIAITPNATAPPSPPTTAPSGMKKNTSIPLSPSKRVVLKISIQASPAPMPSAAPPSTPSTRPSSASNAIFMDVMSYGCLQSLGLVVAGASEVQRQDENKLRSHSGGIAREIGVEPTARHAADLGIIPVV